MILNDWLMLDFTDTDICLDVVEGIAFESSWISLTSNKVPTEYSSFYKVKHLKGFMNKSKIHVNLLDVISHNIIKPNKHYVSINNDLCDFLLVLKHIIKEIIKENEACLKKKEKDEKTINSLVLHMPIVNGNLKFFSPKHKEIVKNSINNFFGYLKNIQKKYNLLISVNSVRNSYYTLLNVEYTQTKNGTKIKYTAKVTNEEVEIMSLTNKDESFSFTETIAHTPLKTYKEILNLIFTLNYGS